MHKFYYLLLSCLNLLCNDQIGNKAATRKNSFINIDTSTTAILNYDSASYVFPSSFKAVNGSNNDMRTIDSLMELTVYKNRIGEATVFTPHKNAFDSIKPISVILKYYKRQLVFATNEKGETIVWINCFCTDDGNDWKKEIVLVEDGGDCFFNFKINLATKKVYDVNVNGYG